MSETREEKITRLTKQIKEHAQELEDSAPFAAYGPAHERTGWREHCADEAAWIRHKASVIANVLDRMAETEEES